MLFIALRKGRVKIKKTKNMSKSKEKRGFQLKLFNLHERKEMKIYFNILHCKIKQLDFENYRDGERWSDDYVSFRLFDEKGRDFSIYGFKISRNNEGFYLEKPKGFFVEGSLWKEIVEVVLGEYEYRFPNKSCY